MTLKTVVLIAGVAGLLGIGIVAGTWFLRPGVTPERLDPSIARLDALLLAKDQSDQRVSVLTEEIRQLRTQAARDAAQATVGIQKADVIGRETALLRARVGQLEDAWRGFQAPKTLPEARRQLETAADLVRAFQVELQAKDSEIGQLREAVTLLTSANTKQEIALAKADAREEFRQELVARFDAELRGLRSDLEGIRGDLEAERKQRARERWMSLIPLIGVALFLFGGVGG